MIFYRYFSLISLVILIEEVKVVFRVWEATYKMLQKIDVRFNENIE